MNCSSISLTKDDLDGLLQNGGHINLITSIPLPEKPSRRYSHIRLCNLFYYGTPLGDIEKQLLQDSVDIVVCGDTRSLPMLADAAPSQTPKILYTNISNIYVDILEDWKQYAIGNKINPEVAFLHDSDGQRILYNGRPNRPLTNPSSPEFAMWTLCYHKQFLAKNPRANGLFVDNSVGKPPATSLKPVEDVSNYATAYASILGLLSSLGTVIPNTSGATPAAIDLMAASCGWWYQEFMLRPLFHNWKQFEDTAAVVAGRQAAYGAKAILDSHPAGGGTDDPRTQLATLAYYYLLANPDRTYLNFFGGFSPSTTWERHWCPAAAVDIGTPTEHWRLAQTGIDPSDSNATYRIYARSYTKATVFYRPLSFKDWQTKADPSQASMVLLAVSGAYLNSNGSQSTGMSGLPLRNGEGAIIVV